MCYTERETEPRHCHERHKPWHPQKHQQTYHIRLLPKIPRTTLNPVRMPSDKPHIHRHSFPMNTHETNHKRCNPPASHNRQWPRKFYRNSAATILHTPIKAYQTLNQHAAACMQHRYHAEHSPKACMVQEREETDTPCTGSRRGCG